MQRHCLVSIIILNIWGCGASNHAPVIDPIEPQVAIVGATLELPVIARDQDGDYLKFTATPNPHTARFEERDGVKYFIWSPLPPDAGPEGTQNHLITFQVDDGKGGIATRTVTITVKLAVGPPVFIGGAGHVLNLSEDDDISFVVSVKDDDSELVILNVTQGIPGSKFVKVDAKSASFYWKPSKQQIEQGNYWPIEVAAKDEKHEEVRRQYSILLTNSDAAKSCRGTPPVIVHAPISDHVDSSMVFKVEATDFESKVREAWVHFALTNPQNGESYAGNLVQLNRCTYPNDPGCPEKIENRYFIGVMPSPITTVPLLFHYYITVVDNDDVKGTTCDLESRLPKVGYFTTAVYPPGWSGPCKDDDDMEDNDTLQQAKPLGAGVTLERRACNKSSLDEDWYQIDVVPGTLLSLELLYEKSHGALELSIHDATGAKLSPGPGQTVSDHTVFAPNQTPVYARVAVSSGQMGTNLSYGIVVNTTEGACDNDDVFEPNDTPAMAKLVQTGVYETIICPGDRDYFSISAAADQSIVAELDFQHSYGDIDIALYDSFGKRVATSETNSSQERIVHHVKELSSYILEVKGYQGAINTAELRLSVVPTNSLCFEDGFSPNHVLAQSQLLPENQYGPLLICSGKEDWFRIDVNEKETVLVYAYPLVYNGGVLDMKVYHDPQAAQPVPDIMSPEEKEMFPPDAVKHKSLKGADGGVWFRIATPGVATFPYLLSFSVYDQGGACVNDRFAPNNTPKEALEVSTDEGFVTRLKICGPGDDWFKIKGKAFEELFVYVFGFPSEKPMLTASLHKYIDPQGGGAVGEGPTATEPSVLVQVDQGVQTTNGVELRFLPDKNEDFYIHVRGGGLISYHYDLVFGSE